MKITLELSDLQVAATKPLAEDAGLSVEAYFTARCMDVANSYVGQYKQGVAETASENILALPESDQKEILAFIESKLPPEPEVAVDAPVK